MSYVRLSRRPLLFGSFTGLEITEFDIISKEIESEYYEHERKRLSVYFDGTNTTNRILKVLEEEKLEIVLLDELDKLPRNFAEKLLNFLESGRVKVDQKKCQMDFELKACKVFATANEINRLSKPLQSRFRKLFLPRYTEGQFSKVSEKVLPKTSPSIAMLKVYKTTGV